MSACRWTGRLRGWLAGMVVVLCTQGCAVQLAYDNVDRIARWLASDFVSMDEAQRTRFDADVKDVWDWHRRTHVPRYAHFFEALPGLLADGTDPAEIEGIVNTVIDWALEIEQQSLPAAIDLLVSLSDEQVAALGRRMAESNEKLAEDERGQTLEESRDQWEEQTASRFGHFSGRLTPAQDAYLAEQSVRYLPDTVLWAEYRSRWQGDLMKLLAQREDRERFASGFRELVAKREQYYGAELSHVWDNNQTLGAEVMAWLINSLTVAQRKHFDDELRSLAAEFREIAGEDAPAPDDLCTPLFKC